MTTYRSPRSLELCLAALAADAGGLALELLVCDDGDVEHQSRGPARAAAASGAFASVRRLWQEHGGYGKCRLANKAAAVARAPLLFYLDGDCLVARGTLRAHLGLAGPRRYVAGNALRLGQRASAELSVEDARAFRHASPGFIARQALRGEIEAKAHYALLRWAGLAPLFRRVGRGGFNGGCSTVPLELLREVNGWEESLPGYGFDDTDLGHRLQNAGAVPVNARLDALVVHLWHDRPYRDPALFEERRKLVAATLHGPHVRAVRGLEQQGPHDAGVWEEIWKPDDVPPLAV